MRIYPRAVYSTQGYGGDHNGGVDEEGGLWYGGSSGSETPAFTDGIQATTIASDPE